MPHPFHRCSPEMAELFYYGELSADAACQFQEHLEACAACQKHLGQLQRISHALVNRAPQPPASTLGLRARTLQHLAAPRPSWRPLLAATTAVACLLLAVLLRTSPQPTVAANSSANNLADEEFLQLLVTLDRMGNEENYQQLAIRDDLR